MTNWRIDAANALEAHNRRGEYVSHLKREAAPHSDFAAAELIYGELVANVARHVGGPVQVVVEWDTFATLRVCDSGPGFYTGFRLPDTFSETGRGLYLVKQLSRAVEVDCDTSGCEVRAVLPITKV